MTNYEPGQKVYKVVDKVEPEDPPESGHAEEWMMQERTIAKVSAKMLRLDRPFSFSYASAGLVAFDVAARTFATSEVGAIELFIRDQERQKRAAEQRLTTCRSALDWALEEKRGLEDDRPGDPCSERRCELQRGHAGAHRLALRVAPEVASVIATPIRRSR